MNKRIIKSFGIFLVGIMFVLGFLNLRRANRSEENEKTSVSETSVSDEFRTEPTESNSVVNLSNEVDNMNRSSDNNDISDTVVGELLDMSIVPVIMDKGIGDLNDFFPIHDSTIMQMVSEIKKTNDSLVSYTMLKELNVVVKDNILGYKHGDANEIFSNLSRAPFRVASFAQEWQRKAVREITKERMEELFGADYEKPSDPIRTVKFIIECRNGGSSGSRYKHVYDQLSVEGSEITFSETNSVPSTFRKHFDILRYGGQIKFPNGLVTCRPTFEYLNSPSTVLKKYGKIILADVRLAASNSNGSRYSRLKRYYWSEDDQTWLPMDFCFFNAKRGRVIDEFF